MCEQNSMSRNRGMNKQNKFEQQELLIVVNLEIKIKTLASK